MNRGNVTSPNTEHDTAKDDRLPPGEDVHEPATDRGTVVPFVTQLDATMDGQQFPDWDSCEPGEMVIAKCSGKEKS